MALTKIQAAGLTADLIDETKLADDSIDSEHYNDGSIDNAHLADDAVGVAELSATGTASSSTFLRGDNSWVTPTDTNTVYTHPNHSGDVTSSGDGATTIADNAVTLAKMAGGTDGQIITYDASGDPVAVGPGTDGQVLTSTGAGSPPAFEALPASGKILGYAYTSTTAATDCSAFTSFTTIGSFALNYTPIASNSKLLFYATLNLTVRANNSSYYGNMEVRFKHSTHATTEEWDLQTGTGSGSSTSFTWPTTFVQEFDAVDTNARDIEVEIHNASAISGGANNGHLYFNEYSGRSTMSLIEVAA